MKLWHLMTGYDLLTLKPDQCVGELRFSPDGHRLLLIASRQEGGGSRGGAQATVWDGTPLPR